MEDRKITSAFHSNEYDSKMIQTVPYYEELYKQVTDIVLASGKENICWLDAGCGTGKMAEAAYKQILIKKFIFCDRSPEMIAIAKNKFSFPEEHFIVKSVQELSYKNEFDVITAIQVNHYLTREERRLSVKNCYDGLRKDGFFISFENFAPNTNYGKELLLKRWKNFQMDHGKSEEESQKHIDRYGTNYYPITISEHTDLLQTCGFKTVEVIWISYIQAGFLAIK